MSFKKAQIFSLDLIFAVVLFISVLYILVSVWQSGLGRIASTEERNSLEMVARNAANLLVLTAGVPSNWITDVNNMNSLGLAVSSSINNLNSTYKSRSMGLNKNGARTIDVSKITALQSMGYNASKPLLGLFAADEHYSLALSQWDGSSYILRYTLGLAPYENTGLIVNINRFVLLDGRWAQLNLKMWKECTEAVCT
jgi:hypothetical protein